MLSTAIPIELFLHPLNFPDKEHIRQHTDDGDSSHVDKCWSEIDVGDEEADDNQGRDRGQIADEVENASGQAQQSLRRQRRQQRTSDLDETIAEERDRYEHDDPCRGVSVVRTVHEQWHGQADDDREFPRHTQRQALLDHEIRKPLGEQHTDETSNERQRSHEAQLA